MSPNYYAYRAAPFDISDELKLRNRYILGNYNKITVRAENLWTWCFDNGLKVPREATFDQRTQIGVWRIDNISPDPCDYDYRHISTTYNMDRLIDPCGVKMLSINDPNFDGILRKKLVDVYDSNDSSVREDFAQIVVNLKDYRDTDSIPTVYTDVNDPNRYYGLEKPFIYISEITRNFQQDLSTPTKFINPMPSNFTGILRPKSRISLVGILRFKTRPRHLFRSQ